MQHKLLDHKAFLDALPRVEEAIRERNKPKLELSIKAFRRVERSLLLNSVNSSIVSVSLRGGADHERTYLDFFRYLKAQGMRLAPAIEERDADGFNPVNHAIAGPSPNMMRLHLFKSCGVEVAPYLTAPDAGGQSVFARSITNLRPADLDNYIRLGVDVAGELIRPHCEQRPDGRTLRGGACLPPLGPSKAPHATQLSSSNNPAAAFLASAFPVALPPIGGTQVTGPGGGLK